MMINAFFYGLFLQLEHVFHYSKVKRIVPGGGGGGGGGQHSDSCVFGFVVCISFAVKIQNSHSVDSVSFTHACTLTHIRTQSLCPFTELHQFCFKSLISLGQLCCLVY